MNTNNLNINIEQYLKKNEYPGRIIILGLNDLGCLVIVYAIMGRTKNSQNRFFEQDSDGTIRTAPIDVTMVKKPELIIYNAITEVKIDSEKHAFIVTNGRQTDALTLGLKTRKFKDILNEWKHEPDGPNYTSRISGVIYINKNSSLKFSLSIIKAGPSNPENNSIHEFFEELPVLSGTGFCISTYSENGDPLPAFKGEPFEVPIIGDAEKIAQTYWNILNPEYRVALVVKTINPMLLTSSVFIINRKKTLK